MPADLGPGDPRIVVHDRSGDRLPYSRGIMATSLLATGVPTEEAYRLASLIQARLLHRHRHDVEAHELVELAIEVLGDDSDHPLVADRWKAWRQAKRSGRPIVIALGGAPGSGKSTLATRMAVRLGITRVVTTDAIREVLRVVVPATVLPELHRSTFDLIPDDGPRRFDDFDRQAFAVGQAAAAVAERLATEHRSMIVEGVHLVPGALVRSLAGHEARPIVVERIVMIDEARHSEHLRGRSSAEPLRGADRYLDRFSILRAIQGHLVEQADEAGVTVVDVHETTELTQSIVDEIARLASEVGADGVAR